MSVRKSFVDRSSDYELDISNPINVTCPVNILHGMKDKPVDYMRSLKILTQLQTEEVELTLSKTADHQFSHPRGLQLLSSAVLEMMEK